MTSDPKTVSRRLYVSMLVSLDGFIAGPKGELDWFVDGDPVFEQYCDEMVDSVGLALYGRRAYELMVSYWPAAEEKPRSAADRMFARKMNALPKVVLSTTLKSASWNNTRVIGEDVGEAIAAMKREPGKPIVAWAGAGLVSTLSKLDLVDEYRLLVHPVVLGAGIRLWDGVPAQKLRLLRTTQLGPSLTLLCYEPIRA
jgi:dihydrofolate reductase